MPPAVDSPACAVRTMSGVTLMVVARFMAAQRCRKRRRFRRHAGDVEQADRSRRGGGRAECLQRILAGMRANA